MFALLPERFDRLPLRRHAYFTGGADGYCFSLEN
jgi:hypothetical protein